MLRRLLEYLFIYFTDTIKLTRNWMDKDGARERERERVICRDYRRKGEFGKEFQERCQGQVPSAAIL